jgi:hypothetical protein
LIDGHLDYKVFTACANLQAKNTAFSVKDVVELTGGSNDRVGPLVKLFKAHTKTISTMKALSASATIDVITQLDQLVSIKHAAIEKSANDFMDSMGKS